MRSHLAFLSYIVQWITFFRTQCIDSNQFCNFLFVFICSFVYLAFIGACVIAMYVSDNKLILRHSVICILSYLIFYLFL